MNNIIYIVGNYVQNVYDDNSYDISDYLLLNLSMALPCLN